MLPKIAKPTANHSHESPGDEWKASQTQRTNEIMKHQSTRSCIGRHQSRGQNDDTLDNEEIGLDKIQAPPPVQNNADGPTLERE